MGEESIKKIKEKGQEVIEILCQRNKQYGDTYKNPGTTYIKASAIDMMKMNMEQKKMRVEHGLPIEQQRDTLIDEIGYRILLLILMDEEKLCQSQK